MSENNSFMKIIILAILGILILAAGVLYFVKPMIQRNNLPKPVHINTENQPTIGNTNAKLKFVVFEDLKCSNCARFSTQVFPYIKKHYLDKNLASYTMINVAFIPDSMPAANAARCVYEQNPALFFPYTDYIFQHQPPENENWATIPTLLDFANHVPGINSEKLAECLIKRPYDAFIKNNFTDANKLMKEVSTPSLYINGITVLPPTKDQIQLVIRALK